MRTRLLIIFLFLLLLLAACQRGGSAPAMRVIISPLPTMTKGPAPTINVVTVVVATRTTQANQDIAENSPTEEPTSALTTEATRDRLCLSHAFYR